MIDKAVLQAMGFVCRTPEEWGEDVADEVWVFCNEGPGYFVVYYGVSDAKRRDTSLFSFLADGDNLSLAEFFTKFLAALVEEVSITVSYGLTGHPD